VRGHGGREGGAAHVWVGGEMGVGWLMIDGEPDRCCPAHCNCDNVVWNQFKPLVAHPVLIGLPCRAVCCGVLQVAAAARMMTTMVVVVVVCCLMVVQCCWMCHSPPWRHSISNTWWMKTTWTRCMRGRGGGGVVVWGGVFWGGEGGGVCVGWGGVVVCVWGGGLLGMCV